MIPVYVSWRLCNLHLSTKLAHMSSKKAISSADGLPHATQSAWNLLAIDSLGYDRLEFLSLLVPAGCP